MEVPSSPAWSREFNPGYIPNWLLGFAALFFIVGMTLISTALGDFYP